MKPTVKKIAEDLNLSQATISKALAGRQEISEETRERVMKHATEIGYLKSPSMRRRLGVLTVNSTEMDEALSSITFNALMGFQQYANRMQQDVVIIRANSHELEQPTLERLARAHQVDGLFVIGLSKTDPYYIQLETTETPIVTMDIRSGNPMVGHVGTDSIAGGALAVNHLVELGHRRIGFVNGHKEAYISQERLAGYFSALHMHGIEFDYSLCFDGDFSMESGESAADYFIKTDATAIYFASDLMALGALKRFQSLGVSLPQEVSIIGFDNLALCQGCSPTLTTIAQEPMAIGESACVVLHGLVQKIPVRHVRLEPRLVVRESTGLALASR